MMIILNQLAMTGNFTKAKRVTRIGILQNLMSLVLILGISSFSKLEAKSNFGISNKSELTKAVSGEIGFPVLGNRSFSGVVSDYEYFSESHSVVRKAAATPPPVTIGLIATVVDETCKSNNGSISVQLSNAIAPISYSWTGPNGFTSSSANISNLKPGTYTLNVIDFVGSIGSTSVSVNRIVDVTAPVVNYYSYVEVALDTADNYVFTNNDLIISITDDCATTVTYSPSSVNCSNVGGIDSIWVFVSDVFGNTDSGRVAVKAMDITAPEVNIYSKVIVQLDQNGSASVFASSIDSLSYDNCSDVFFTLSQSSFDCADLPYVDILVTAVDGSGNSENDTWTKNINGTTITYSKNDVVDEYTVRVFVDDCLPPVAICKDIQVNLDANDYD